MDPVDLKPDANLDEGYSGLFNFGDDQLKPNTPVKKPNDNQHHAEEERQRSNAKTAHAFSLHGPATHSAVDSVGPLAGSAESSSETPAVGAVLSSSQNDDYSEPPAPKRFLSPQLSPFLFNKKALAITLSSLAVIMLVGLASFWGFLAHSSKNPSSSGKNNGQPTSNFGVVSLPLDQKQSAQILGISQARQLAVNGQLQVNDTLVLAPMAAPSSATPGQIYYDAAAKAPFYYNGNQFVSLLPQTMPQHVSTLGGADGNIGVGNGLQVAGGQLSLSSTVLQQLASGVTSVQGQSGSVNFTAGTGIALNGLTISNSGVTVLNGATGSLSIANTTTSSGTISIDKAKADGSTLGLATFNATNFTASNGLINTVQNIATTSSPQFAGLTLGTPLLVASGGTGASSLAANGVLVGNGSGAVSSVVAGAAGLCFISTGGPPTFSACPGGGGGAVMSVNGQVGAVVIDNATGAGGHVTIQNASTTQLGLAQFNSSHFSVASGVVSLANTVTLQGNTFNGSGQLVQLDVGGQAGSSGLCLMSTGTGSGSAFQACPVGGNISSGAAQTAGNLVMFDTTANKITNSIASQSGTTITVSGTLTATTLSGNGAGVTNVNAAQLGGNSASFFQNASNINSGLLGVTYGGTGVNASTAANGQLLIGNGSGLSLATLTAGSGVNITNGAGSITISAPSAGSCSTCANTALSNLSGVALNTSLLTGSATIDLGSNANPFRDLYLGGTATNNFRFTGTATAARTYTLPDASGTLAVSASGNLALSAAGNLTTVASPTFTNITATGTINGQTISSSANFTGTLAVQGANVTVGTSSTAGTLVLNNGAGASNHTATLQAFATLGQNTTYTLPDPGAATASICLSTGNCAGSGGGVTTPGGTTNKLAKFTGSQTLGDSNISDNGTTVSISSGAAIQGSAGLTLGASGVTGKLVFDNSTNANTLTLQSGTTGGNLTFTLPTADGSSGNCLQTNGAGVLSFGTCLSGGGGSGGVTSLNSLTGVLSLNGTANQVNVASGGSTITLSTPQDIATTSSPTFSSLTLSAGTTGLSLTGAPTNSATSSLVQLGSAIVGGNSSVNGGTYIGLNEPASGAGSAADFINLQAGGAPKFVVTNAGNITAGTFNSATISGGTLSGGTLSGGTVSGGSLSASAVNGLSVSAGTISNPTISGTVTGSGSPTITGFGTINGQTISSSANFTGTLAVQGANVTVGTSSTAGTLVLNNGGGVSNHTATLQAAASLGQNTTYTLPDPGAATANLCLSTGNCATAGAAGGDLTGSYPNPTIAKLQGTTLTISALSSGQVLQYNGSAFVNGLITNSNLQAGSFSNITGVGTLGSLTVSGASALQGTITLGTTSSAGSLVLNNGNGASNHTATLQAFATLGQNTVYTLPDPGSASVNICLSSGNCIGSNGGGINSSGTSNFIPIFSTDGYHVINSVFSEDSYSSPTQVNIGVTTVQGNGALTIGAGGTNQNLTLKSSGTGRVVIKPGTDSTAALQVQQSGSSTAVLNVDTSNGQLSVEGITNSNASLGSELMGSTTNFSTNWSGTNWTNGAASAVHTTGATNADVYSGFTPVSGTTYQVTFTFSGAPGNGTDYIWPMIGSTTGEKIYDSSVTSLSELIVASSTASLQFIPTSNWNGSITSVSVKAVTSANAVLSVLNSSATAGLEVRASTNSGDTFLGVSSGQNNTTGTQNTATGYQALQNNTTGGNNAAYGYQSLQQNTTGVQNTAMGPLALQNNTSGQGNTANGYLALEFNSTGSQNTAIGYTALQNNLTGQYNTGLGAWTLQNNTTGSSATAVGAQALQNNTTGSFNSALGYQALQNNTTGSNNAAFGYQALSSNTTGNSNSAFGYQALQNNTTGNTQNSAFGLQALQSNTTGTGNVAMGYQALQRNTTGSTNNAFGDISLWFNTTGSNNNAFGGQALQQNTTGNNNTAMGSQALLFNSTGSGNTAYGANALTNLATPSGNITSIVSNGGNIQITTGSTTSISTGLSVTISGTTNYNGTWTVASVDSTTQFTLSKAWVANESAGTWTAPAPINNTAVGYQAGNANGGSFSFQGNSLVGYQAGYNLQSGANYNSLLGYQAGTSLSTGNTNLLLGKSAGSNLTTGSNNIIIGSVNATSATGSNQLQIGPAISGDLSLGTLKISSQTDTTGTLQVVNHTGTTLLTVDTSTSNLTLGSSTAGSTTIQSSGGLVLGASGHQVTLQAGGTTTSYSITLPTSGPAVSQCLQTDSVTATQLKFGSCSGNITLQSAYTGSVGGTTPEIKLDSTRGGVDIQDADTTIGASLFNVRASNGSGLGTSLFSVGNTGNITTQTTTNSTTAFQVQDASSGNLLAIDDTNGGIVSVNSRNSALTNSWASTTSLPANNSHDAGQAIVADGYVFVAGGFDNNSGTMSAVHSAKINNDGTIGSWTAVNSLPGARMYPGGAYANGYIYIVGGEISNLSTFYNTVYYAKVNPNGTLGTWQSATNTLPINVGELGSFAYNGYLYAIGGQNGTYQSTVYYAKLNADGSVGSWNTNTNALPAVRSQISLSTVAANGYVYVVGGGTSTARQDTIFYAKLNSDGSIGSWSCEGENSTVCGMTPTNSNFLPEQKQGTSVVAMNGYLYYFGGDEANAGDANAKNSEAVLNSDGSTGAWAATTVLPNLPANRERGPVVTDNGNLLYISGRTAGTAQVNVYYAATEKLKVAGSLDLVSLTAKTLADPGSSGTLTAGNTTIVGTLSVSQDASFYQNLSVTGLFSASNLAAFTGTPQASATSSLVQLGPNAISGGSANGTYIGANPSSFTGDFINLQVGNTSEFKVTNAGDIYTQGTERLSGTGNLFNTNLTGGTGVTAGTSAGTLVTNSSGTLSVATNSTGGQACLLSAGNTSTPTFGTCPSATGAWNLLGTNTGGNILGSNAASAGITIASAPGTTAGAGTGASYIQFSGASSAINKITISGNANSTSRGGGSFSTASDWLEIQDSSGNIAMAFQGFGSNAHEIEADLIASSSGPGDNGHVCTGSSSGGLNVLEVCSGGDLAERYNSTQSLTPGELVATDPGNYPYVLMSSSTRQSNLIGIVSTHPNNIMNDAAIPDNGGYPIALTGRVPTLVNNEGGAIHTGDRITSSSTTGVGMKATSPGMTVGIALQDYSGTGTGTIEVLVEPGWFDPTGALAMQGSDVSFASLNVSGKTTLSDLAVTGTAKFNGMATFNVGITVNGHIITAGNTPASQVLAAAGSGGTVTLSGNDTSGTITITTGASGLSAGDVADITFNQAYGAVPHVVISGQDDNSVNSPLHPSGKSTSDFKLHSSTALQANTTYTFDYFIAQ